MPSLFCMSSSSTPQSCFRFCDDSVEMMPKLSSFGRSCAAAGMAAVRMSAASSFLSMRSLLVELEGVGDKPRGTGFENRDVVGQREDLVGLGAVELAQQRGREVDRWSVVHHAPLAQGDGARAVLERDVHLVQRH